LSLKRPLDDGRHAIELLPTELLSRLATLVPPPRAHLVRFHGVFGQDSRWWAEVVPSSEQQLPARPPCEPAPPKRRSPSSRADARGRPARTHRSRGSGPHGREIRRADRCSSGRALSSPTERRKASRLSVPTSEILSSTERRSQKSTSAASASAGVAKTVVVHFARAARRSSLVTPKFYHAPIRAPGNAAVPKRNVPGFVQAGAN
jgi:hypothetical protein